MSVKKIKLKTKPEKLVEVVGLLFSEKSEVSVTISQSESSKDLTVVSVYLEENKKTFTLLAVCEDILDWEFDESDTGIRRGPIILGPSEHNPPRSMASPVAQDVLEEIEKPIKFEPKEELAGLEIKTFGDLANFIEAAWMVGLKSPGLIMKSVLGWKKIKETYAQITTGPISVDRTLLRMILESYYSGGLSIEEATEDVVERLGKLWKTISSYKTISSIAQALFKK